MPTMYLRALGLPGQSFLLVGPRGTGKTTWLRQALPHAEWFDLLRMATVLELARDPERFRARVEARPRGTWVVVDEVPKLPALLDEVQSLIADHGTAYRFALCGSSARKLRRMEVNLLAGRVAVRQFFPLTLAELGDSLPLNDLLRFGMLPSVRAEPTHAVDILDAYVTTYLREEVQQEALTKDFAAFSRFLEVAALSNGQVVNVAGTARDAGVTRMTVARYYQVLVDTLIGFWLPAWQSKVRIKEVRHPKFYLFDPGVARALLGRIREPLEAAERGALLETLVLHELRAAMSVHNAGGDLSYWRTPAGVEVDFIWRRGRRVVGVEVKASGRWRREDTAVLRQLMDEKVLTAGYLVYGGSDVRRDRGIDVLPFEVFAGRAARGGLFG
ncbi:MAG: ATPase [Gemmatimonas sp.]|nr:ATPase [Gemmatimonas sp.]